MWTNKVRRSPAGDEYHRAVAAKHMVLPIYIGFSTTLKGNPVTRSDIRMPK
jgi:hypothetical protein